ncbi:hypothetical protein G7K_0598-t1 [Saitoella complicata NRRL Y-17804]|uniref:Uncharacterized protein n=1 Tax=Saitoella complicata (strain BCRC 22490 / CBS 7301 / JCM 7358 / NBRC 10748 / NRRL Y-17804) TaxID=698492 RepID=A0A0E9N918_SAICN|nr:hypothetical protein G7K_0598-t1 [Saitoella complicata NRRL Y-17804]
MIPVDLVIRSNQLGGEADGALAFGKGEDLLVGEVEGVSPSGSCPLPRTQTLFPYFCRRFADDLTGDKTCSPLSAAVIQIQPDLPCTFTLMTSGSTSHSISLLEKEYLRPARLTWAAEVPYILHMSSAAEINTPASSKHPRRSIMSASFNHRRIFGVFSARLFYGLTRANHCSHVALWSACDWRAHEREGKGSRNAVVVTSRTDQQGMLICSSTVPLQPVSIHFIVNHVHRGRLCRTARPFPIERFMIDSRILLGEALPAWERAVPTHLTV